MKKVTLFIICIIVLFGSACDLENGKTIPVDIPYEEFESEREELLEEYNVSEDIYQLTIEDFKAAYPNDSLTINYNDEPRVCYPDLPVLCSIAQEVIDTYSKFSSISYAKYLEKNFSNISEDEFNIKMNVILENINTEMQYMITREIQKEENHQFILSIAREKTKSGPEEYLNTKLTKKEFWYLAARPLLIEGAQDAFDEAFAATAVFDENNNGHRNGDKSDAFRHAYISILLAQKAEPFYSRDESLAFSREFMTLRETSRDELGINKEVDMKMDLHNNSIGRDFYLNNSYDVDTCLYFIFFRICFKRGKSISIETFTQLIEKNINDNKDILPYDEEQPDIVNTDLYKNILVYYEPQPVLENFENERILSFFCDPYDLSCGYNLRYSVFDNQLNERILYGTIEWYGVEGTKYWVINSNIRDEILFPGNEAYQQIATELKANVDLIQTIQYTPTILKIINFLNQYDSLSYSGFPSLYGLYEDPASIFYKPTYQTIFININVFF